MDFPNMFVAIFLITRPSITLLSYRDAVLTSWKLSSWQTLRISCIHQERHQLTSSSSSSHLNICENQCT